MGAKKRDASAVSLEQAGGAPNTSVNWLEMGSISLTLQWSRTDRLSYLIRLQRFYLIRRIR